MKAFCKIVGVSLITVASGLFAATEFPGNLVPADVAKAFTSGSIYKSLPDNFPTPTLPAGTPLYVLGSVDNTYAQQLLLGTTLAAGEIREILKKAYATNGWVDLSRYPDNLELCHDVQGVLSFRMTAPVGTENRVFVNRSRRIPIAEPAMTCAEQLAYQNGGPATTPFLIFQDAIPLLKMPTSAQSPIPSFPISISSGSGPNGTFYQSNSDTGATIPGYSLENLQEFVAQQMTEEGWTLDGDFVGSKSASAVWFKTVFVPVRGPVGVPAGIATEMVLTADITLLNLKADDYSLSLRVTAGDQPPRTPIGIRGIGSFFPR